MIWLYFLFFTALWEENVRENDEEKNLESSAECHWPQWRGPDSDGMAALSDPPIILNDQNLIWKIQINGNGHGTPIVWGNRIFIQTAIPVEKDMPVPNVIPAGTPNVTVNPEESVVRWKPQKFAVVCLDRKTGNTLWQKTVHEAMPHQGHHFKGGFASQSMVTDGERVYAYFGSYGLYCFDLKGRLIWQHAAKPQAMEAGLGEGSSPAIDGRFLVIVVDQETQSYVACFDKRNGKLIWKTNRDEPSNWSTPRIFNFENQKQVVVNGVRVRSYALKTGELIWECGGHTASAIPVPAVGNGMVYNTSGWSKDKLQAIRLGQRGDLTESENVIWSLERGTPYVPSPLLWGDELYLLDDRSFFSCYNAINGKPYYKTRLPGTLNFSASPIGADDRIYLASEEGSIVVMKRGKTSEILHVNELGDAFFASPVILGDRIYLRGKKFLYCFGRK